MLIMLAVLGCGGPVPADKSTTTTDTSGTVDTALPPDTAVEDTGTLPTTTDTGTVGTGCTGRAPAELDREGTPILFRNIPGEEVVATVGGPGDFCAMACDLEWGDVFLRMAGTLEQIRAPYHLPAGMSAQIVVAADGPWTVSPVVACTVEFGDGTSAIFSVGQ